jgi:hypothetical protein
MRYVPYLEIIDETFMNVQSEVELQEEDRLAEQREEAVLQIKRERAQRLAVKRGLSDIVTPVERPRSAQGTLRDAIPLRRGRSSTLQSQVSDIVPLRGRSSTLGSQSSGLPSPRIEERSRPTSPSPNPQTASVIPKAFSLKSLDEFETTSSTVPLRTPEEPEFSEFIQADTPLKDM